MFAKLSFAILLFVIATSQANAELTANQIKVISDLSKFSGMCVTYQEITRFQAKNQTLGEFQFIAQFMAAEAARLGLPSAMALWERCVAKNEEYAQIYKHLE